MRCLKSIQLFSLLTLVSLSVQAQCPWEEKEVEVLGAAHFSEYSREELWDLKMNIRHQMNQAYEQDEFDLECSKIARDLFYKIREKEDYLDEQMLRQEGVVALDHSFEDSKYLRMNPRYSDRNLLNVLRSGDVILSRGKAYTSAAISNLGEFDTQFSHLSFVYQDEEGKFWTIESHIEVGAFVRDLEDHIDDKNARTVVFRYQDPELAHQAAKAAFEKVKTAFYTRGPINYDFGFDKQDSSELFCSEVVSHGFDLVTNNSIDIPLYESEIFKRKPKIVTQLGLKAQKSFIPADIEVDPRFELISEWKNPNIIADILQKDAVLHALFKWSDEEGHILQQGSTGTSLLYRNIVWPMRRVPILKRFFLDKLPLNMSREMVGYFGVLETIGKILHKELIQAEDELLSTESRILSAEEKGQVLEDFRSKNTKQAKKFRKSFHP
ncbi:MAG TPA: YiiX/YebB-like N1pC/P60 family cysteine hydrolase [Bacteriovoracaceae bacterium]|nr:YiiX/YebB-like N1pC/P60 family cysteine hydrolase [Bacteriovoracaceae bacterium]